MITNLEKSNLHLAPKIKTYMNAYKYLGDYYEYRKNQDNTFSYEMWAAELGFKSKSSVRMVCKGQKMISDLFIESFAQKVGLEQKEKDYFYLLANYQNTKSSSLKRAYLDKIIENMDTTENYSEIKNYTRFLSSPALPLLQLIISFSDFKATESKLKEITGLAAKRIKESLKTLEKLGLAQPLNSEKESEQVWSSKIKYFKVPDKLNDGALVLYHQGTCKEAYDILNKPIDLKKFKSIFFSLNENDYADLSQDLEEFITKIKFKYGNNSLMKKQLYKVNLQVYPITKKVMR